MKSKILRAGLRAARTFTAVSVAAAGLSACDGPRHPPPSLELTVTSTDAPAAVRGEDAHFVITVTNPTSHDVKAVDFLDFAAEGTVYRSATCSARGGATCPDLAPAVWSTPVMPAGSSLTFDVAVAVYFGTSTFEHQFDVQASNRLDSVSAIGHGTVVADSRTGVYRVYGGEGSLSDVALDMMANTLAQGSGPALPVQEPDGGGYLSSDGVRFGTGLDVLVGHRNVAGGTEPFIAARRFVMTAAELDGVAFNMFASEVAGGTRQTRAFAGWFEGNTLSTCVQPLLSADNCPADSLRHFDLSVASGVFTGTDAAHGESLTFQVAKSGDSLVFLRAGTGVDFHGLQVGLAVRERPVELGVFGADTRGRWGSLRVTATSYVADWVATPNSTALSETAALSPVPGATDGLRLGQRSSDGAPILGAFDTALAVFVGAPGGAADGEIQLFSSWPPLP